MILRIQYRRSLTNAPSFGKWNVYSNAWFESSTATLSPTVLNLLQRFFCALPVSGAGTSGVGTDHFNRTTGAARLTVWSHSGGVLTNEGEYPVTVPGSGSSPQMGVPSQCAIAIGYRAETGGPVQRGRSRFWLGPISYYGSVMNSQAGQGLYVSPNGQTVLVENVLATTLALDSAGFVLNVKTGTGGGATFSPAVEIYVDNILDVMRSRRSWYTGQQRRTIA